jgi:hypothetical protein
MNMNARRKRPETYEAEVNGKKVRVTVPENPDPVQLMQDAIRDQLSPEAVAAIVSYLQPVSTKDSAVNKEVAWFSERLVEMLGGYEQQSQLADELGL